MPVTLADVRHIAALARLGISNDTAHSMAEELNSILGHMDILSRVDTDSLSESAIANAPGELRADHGPPIPMTHPLDAIAPSMRDGLLLVPRLSSHESADAG